MLKRKALTTSFFDSSKVKSDGRKGSTGTAGGLIFGQPLEKCLSNDNAMNALKARAADENSKLSRTARNSITSLDASIPLTGSGMSSGAYVSFYYNYLVYRYTILEYVFFFLHFADWIL